MKEYIRFFMRNKKLDITLPLEQAERILDSTQQLVKIYDEKGEWMGVTINKAEILGTEHDFDRERHENWKTMKDRALPEPQHVPINDLDRFKPNFLKRYEQL